MIQVVNRSGFVYNKRNISAHGTSPFAEQRPFVEYICPQDTFAVSYYIVLRIK